MKFKSGIKKLKAQLQKIEAMKENFVKKKNKKNWHKEDPDFLDSYGDFIRLMEPGALVGDIAANENKPRSASIYCPTEAQFLVLPNALYQKSLMQFVKLEKRQKKNMVQNLFPGVGFNSRSNFQKMIESINVSYRNNTRLKITKKGR